MKFKFWLGVYFCLAPIAFSQEKPQGEQVLNPSEQEESEDLCERDEEAFSLGIGPMRTNQVLNPNMPISNWQAAGKVRLLHFASQSKPGNSPQHYRVGADFGIVSPSSGNNILSQAIQPELTDFHLSLYGEAHPVGLKLAYHHNSIHYQSDLVPRLNNQFLDYFKRGGYTDIVYLEKHFEAIKSKIAAGAGSMSSGTNIMTFADLPGFLLTSQYSTGLFFRANTQWELFQCKRRANYMI